MTSTAAAGSPAATGERGLAERWAAGLAGPLRLEDGRALHIVFLGVPGGGAGPDFTGAILDAGGDLLRGDVELHLASSGWHAHGHGEDPAYGGVVLHVVAENNTGRPLTPHRSGRLIPVLVVPPREGPPPEAFIPPCALGTAGGRLPGPALDRLGLRRLRMKAARQGPAVAAYGAGQALYAALIETLGGPANRAAFASLARTLPLAPLLEALDANAAGRALAATAMLKGGASALCLRRAGLRPMASPARRLERAGALVARLWPAGAGPAWPGALSPEGAFAALRSAGLPRSLAVECMVNAVLPAGMAAGTLREEDVEPIYLALPSPGTYGLLRPLERWLGTGAEKPFPGAARLQGGLLLHADYCSRGKCGSCPLS